MAKTASDKPTTPAAEELKRRKKQARQEAKLMLEIEAANKDLKKAQKKQSKAQARLEDRSTYVQTLEARLAELRATRAEPETEVSTSTDEEPPLVEVPTASEVMVTTKDVAEREAVQDKKTATESDPSPKTRTPPKASTQKTTAARTSTATKRSPSPSTATKRPASQSSTTRRPPNRSQSTRQSRMSKSGHPRLP